MRRNPQGGFSLPELLIAMTIMLAISGAAVTALLKMQNAQATIWNRTQMHSGIRGATEVLQQEVGQAGRIALAPVTLTSATGAGAAGAVVTLPVTSSVGMFEGMKLTIDTGTASDDTSPAQETVVVTEMPTTTSVKVQSLLKKPDGTVIGKVRAHVINAPVLALGAFGTGVVPPASSPSAYAPGGATFTYANGSTGDVLKLYGDINADGNMVYIEYTCDTATNHNLYRTVMGWKDAIKSAAAPSQVLLSNVIANPNAAPCFTYQTATVAGNRYVTDVAITLTVQTQIIDPVTKQFQTQTKALLNVSPRNTFNAWQMATLGIANRIQPMPPTITALLAPLP
jgi:prepilin-type N-terminal cleavage/methylation domain-containing protein